MLTNSGMGEDGIVGTMLVTKDNVAEQEEMFLYLYDNHPTPKEITKYLIEMVHSRPE